MIERLINEINGALDNNLFIAALNTALTLPDICGKAAFPEISDRHSGERYRKWYGEYVEPYEKDTKSDDNMPRLTAEVVYQLRCALLHQGNPNISAERAGIDCFELAIDSEKMDFAIYVDCSSIVTHADNTQLRKYRVSVHRLCFILCVNAQKYYNEHKDLFNFFNYKIIDMKIERERMKPFLSLITEYDLQRAKISLETEGK